ncbi:MAG: hypothetical protein M1511_15980 [Deltaproteobacteria bacterium]|nr:hypothetical protein [Deltaproteobacteria bacterium]
MKDMKIELSNPFPVRIPKSIIEDLRIEAAKAQRSFSQELRYRIVDSHSRLSKENPENS